MTLPLITLEEHYFSSHAEDLKSLYFEQFARLPELAENLSNLSASRVESMDRGHISLQILSHAPGMLPLEQCRATNDECAAAIKAYPDRFAGFAVLPVADPLAAAQELTRCVTELGFVGALIENRAANTYYDGTNYLPLWKAAHELDVPIYLHPSWPTQQMKDAMFVGNFSEEAAMNMSSSGWGWHTDVGLHILRLYAAGVFDLFPKLKVVIGHMGEAIPFMLHRIVQQSVRWGSRERPFKQVYEENIWITTSGVWSIDPMATILRNTPIDHILYSVDYPFAKNEAGLAWIQDLEKSGLVTTEQMERIAYKNAEELFGVKATKMF